MIHASCVFCTKAGRPVRMSSLAELDAHANTHPTHGLNAPTDHEEK